MTIIDLNALSLDLEGVRACNRIARDTLRRTTRAEQAFLPSHLAKNLSGGCSGVVL
jgi:hypothetical protein